MKNIFKYVLIVVILFIVICCTNVKIQKAKIIDIKKDQTMKCKFFDVKDVPPNELPSRKIKPWKTIKTELGGEWVVTGDIDGDGEIEIVSAKNVNYGDTFDNECHYTSAVSAQKLNGSNLWTWGNPNIGRKRLSYDVACQIYDWNGDGTNEVILAGKDFLYHLDGKTGKVLRKIPLPSPDATDCIIFCNLSGNKRPTDILLKNRYKQIWALDYNGKLLWTSGALPGNYLVGHHPLPIDINGNGKDEIFCGFVILNNDGSVYKTISDSQKTYSKWQRKHLHKDSEVVISKGKKPQDFLFAFTYCVGEAIGLIDGNGKVKKELSGLHFESVNLGKVFPDVPGNQILVDIDHTPHGKSPVLILDDKLNILGRIILPYSRLHKLLDWDGDGFDDIIIGDSGGIYNYKGEKIAKLVMPENGRCMQLSDIDGNGVNDIVLVGKNTGNVYLFKNQNGKKKNIHLGTKTNFTLY